MEAVPVSNSLTVCRLPSRHFAWPMGGSPPPTRAARIVTLAATRGLAGQFRACTAPSRDVRPDRLLQPSRFGQKLASTLLTGVRHRSMSGSAGSSRGSRHVGPEGEIYLTER